MYFQSLFRYTMFRRILASLAKAGNCTYLINNVFRRYVKKKSFTIVELLIVVVVIGILATFVLLSLGNNAKTARDARTKRSISTVRDSLAQYAAANYPVIFNSNAVFGQDAEAKKTSTFNDKLRAGGATALSVDALDAKGEAVKIRFSARGYRIEGKTSSYDGSADKTCWYVLQSDYSIPGNTESRDNLSEKKSTYTCIL